MTMIDSIIEELEREKAALAARLAEAERLLRGAIALDSGRKPRIKWLREYAAYFGTSDSADVMPHLASTSRKDADSGISDSKCSTTTVSGATVQPSSTP